jgi:hypothetical protein
MPMSRSPLALSCALVWTLAAPGAGVSRAAPTLQALQESLIRGQADGLSLSMTWEIGLPGTARRALQVSLEKDQGSAELSSCPASAAAPPSCQKVAPPLTLTAGQRDRLLSGLRSANVATLRGLPREQAGRADRALVLRAQGAQVGAWALPRADWPAAADDGGLAGFLDELAERIDRAAAARRPLPVPRTLAELDGVRLKLHLLPARAPGGVLLIERGVASVTPEEGLKARRPPPAPWQRPLSEEERERLLRNLQAADLDHLEEAVPARAAAAIGDTDGRVATLHLLPPEGAAAGGKGAQGQPRGLRRFLADLQRSPAQALLDQLVQLVEVPPAPAKQGKRPR